MAAQPGSYKPDDYGSLVRDLAGTTALAIEGGDPEIVPAVMARNSAVDMRLNATTTQDKAWMLRAAFELSKETAKLDVAVNGKPVKPVAGAVHVAPTLAQLGSGVTLTNKADAPVWRTVSVQGTPASPLPAASHGLTLTKTVWTMSGAPADLSRLKQNERVIVVLQGNMANNLYRRMAAIDLLPAGLEIESTLSGDDAKAYPWLGSLTGTSVQEARDDRYVAAFNIGSMYRPRNRKGPEPQPRYRLAYIARAVTPGSFEMPAGVVESMYTPGIVARTTMSKVSIAVEK